MLLRNPCSSCKTHYVVDTENVQLLVGKASPYWKESVPENMEVEIK